MADRVTVYSAAFGHFDEPRALPEQDVPVRSVLFTDRPASVDGWEVRVEAPRYAHPRLSAKWYKCLPHLCLPESDFTVWIDANTEVHSRSFVSDLLAWFMAQVLVSNGFPLAAFRHPHRDCIYDEAAASLALAPSKYADQPITAQVETYRSEGHPEHGGLFACGTILRMSSDPMVNAFGAIWLGENLAWSYQDQLSFPVVARRLGIKPMALPAGQLEGPGFGNRWFNIGRHLSAR